MKDKPRPCSDCVRIHGDDPAAWLREWPQGAEYHTDHEAYLCDGCRDERDMTAHAHSLDEVGEW